MKIPPIPWPMTQPCRRPASNRPAAPQLPGRNKKKNTSLLTASAIKVAGSIDDTAATNKPDANEGNISIKGTQGAVGGDNKSDIGRSDGEVGDDNYGNGVIDGNEVNPGGDNKVIITMATAATSKLVMILMAMAESTAMKSTKVAMVVPLVMSPTLRMAVPPSLEMRDL